MPQLAIRLLGPFQVTLNSQPVTGFAYDKVRALLAYLAVEANRSHRRETLATLFWPEHPPKLARQNLRQSLATLRRAINDQNIVPPFLLIDGDTVQFNGSGQTWLDVAAFRTHLSPDGHVHPHADIESWASCIQHMEQAVALYRGEFLADLFLGDSLEFETWAITCREQLHLQALTTLYHLTRYYLRRGDYGPAQNYALRQIALAPYQEEAHRQLMRILAGTGQRSAALAQYQSCRRILAQEFGVEPSAQTQALYKRICAAGTRCPHNLPPQLTPLVGREGELHQLAERLSDPHCRLLTLTGLGGIGKTHLALQSAQEHLGLFLHGVYFVPLAALSSSQFLTATVADALGLSFSGEENPLTQLLNFLREKEMLLVLDNFEHLLPVLAESQNAIDFLLEILKVAPHVKIMVTSRERLNLQAEWVFRVRGLAFPQKILAEDVENYSAVQLFARRARRVDQEFSLSEANKTTVGRICQLLEGMPLGIKLAAASLAGKTPAQIAAQIEQNLDALATSMRDVPERHRSVRAVFEHSWHLLTKAEQHVFQKLTVFRGDFTVRAARQVAQASPEILATLIDKSLLRQNVSKRYELHELLRQFAAEKLDDHPLEKESSLECHCAYYVDFLQQKTKPLKTNYQPETVAEIGLAIENIRAAWQWAAQRANLSAMESCLESLYLFYWVRNGFHEGKQVFEQAEKIALAAGHSDSLLLARIWTRQAEFEAWLAHYDTAKLRLQKSIPICRTLQEQDELALAVDLLGRIHYWQGEYALAEEHFEESLALYRQTSNKAGLAQTLNSLANTVCDMSADYGRAQPLYEESLALARQIGDRFGIARALLNQGAVAQELGNYTQAQQRYRESLAVYREIDYRYGQATALNYLGQVAGLLDEHAAAIAFLQQSLGLCQETGDRHLLANCLNQLGSVTCRRGAYPEAKEYFTNALHLAVEIRAFQVALDILIGVANLFQQQGNKEQALELLVFVIGQSQGYQERINHAMQLLPECEAELTPQVIARCREWGKTQTLNGIVTGILDA